MAKVKDQFKKVKALVFYNTKCIKCHICQEDMIKIGPIPFCNKCYFAQFGNNIKVDTNNEEYEFWLKRHKETVIG